MTSVGAFFGILGKWDLDPSGVNFLIAKCWYLKPLSPSVRGVPTGAGISGTRIRAGGREGAPYGFGLDGSCGYGMPK